MEVFLKYKSEEEGYKKVALEDFMNKVELPAFNHSIKWRNGGQRPQRRNRDYDRGDDILPSLRNKKNQEGPANRNPKTGKPAIVRQHSKTEDVNVKRARKELNTPRSGSYDVEMFATPAGEKSSSDSQDDL